MRESERARRLWLESTASRRGQRSFDWTTETTALDAEVGMEQKRQAEHPASSPPVNRG